MEYHSQTVDPKALTVGTQHVLFLVQEETLSNCPHTRLALAVAQYTDEKVKEQAGGPSISQFIEQPQLVALCRKPESLQSLETHIRSIKQKYMPILEPLLGSQQARLAVSDYINLVVRCILCKPWPKDMKISLPVGKYSDEKVLELGGCWAQTVDLKHPHVSFAEKAGLNKFLNDEQKELDSQEVNLEGCRKLRRDLSGGPDPSTGPKFKKGDKVTVVKN